MLPCFNAIRGGKFGAVVKVVIAFDSWFWMRSVYSRGNYGTYYGARFTAYTIAGNIPTFLEMGGETTAGAGYCYTFLRTNWEVFRFRQDVFLQRWASHEYVWKLFLKLIIKTQAACMRGYLNSNRDITALTRSYIIIRCKANFRFNMHIYLLTDFWRTLNSISLTLSSNLRSA